ncbi:chromosomal replication initiator protein DnaA [Falsiporphyromonas endometrii]|uniref:Chromosomal replication initiator protein DnaA n=1 Tax=Falsiporphyromonas endometrii TaxID=1387297 RepID=A0ABV9KA34_9PORP
MTNNSQHKVIWKDCLAKLRASLNEDAYSTWFTPLVPVAFDGTTLTIQSPSEFVSNHIESNYLKELSFALHSVIGPHARLVYTSLVDSTADAPVDSTISTPSKNVPQNGLPTMTPEESLANQSIAKQGFNSQLNPNLSFSNFVESECNKIAVTVGKTIVEAPGSGPSNPFFMFGPSGVGKTHLCQAIGLGVRQNFPNLRVLYVSSHLFVMQFTTATRTGQYNNFISFYQQIDVLIIDDIQGFINKTATQKAFFEIFNHLYMLGKQIILTSDQPPVELKGMPDRLITRISGSLVVKLERPDVQLRKKILHKQLEKEGIKMHEDIIDFLANSVGGSVRELEGVLVSLITNSVIENREITRAYAEDIIKRSVSIEEHEITIDRILDKVSKICNVPIDKIRENNRQQHLVLARHFCMYLSKKYTTQSLGAIGQMLGGKNHSTVLHGYKTICKRQKNEPEIKATLERIEDALRNED